MISASHSTASPAGPTCHPVRLCRPGALGHTVEVRHELRQILEATPEAVDVGDAAPRAESIPGRGRRARRRGRPCVCRAGHSRSERRPTARDAAIQQGCGRHREAARRRRIVETRRPAATVRRCQARASFRRRSIRWFGRAIEQLPYNLRSGRARCVPPGDERHHICGVFRTVVQNDPIRASPRKVNLSAVVAGNVRRDPQRVTLVSTCVGETIGSVTERGMTGPTIRGVRRVHRGGRR